MEAACPHLGADLSHAEIEDLEPPFDDSEYGHEPEKVIVCPWHRCVRLLDIAARGVEPLQLNRN
jgi:nitrite reductase/ring-hydroxylating ferredoxin subunit